MRHFFYLPWWYLRACLLGGHRPLQTVLFLSDRCNLRCKHCAVYARKEPVSKTYAQVEAELRGAYARGSRFVDFEGGEPFLWRDGDRTVNDLCDLARKIGFFTTTITTNAQLPFPNSHAHSIWVSMDGVGAYHDEIRGAGAFDKLARNVAACGHPHLSVNMVVNKLNYTQIKAAADYARQNPAIEQISFNFHTPYEGTEHLYIDDWDLRVRLLDEIIALKKAGYPIMNSVSGLKRMKNLDFKKACWVSEFIMVDGTLLTECPGKVSGVCDRCGFCMAGEMYSVLHFKPDTLLAGFKLRM